MDPSDAPDPMDDQVAAAERARLRAAYRQASGAEHDAPLGWVAGLLALFGPLVVWAVGVALAAGSASTTVGEGECEGIGFGCRLAPHDGVVLLGVVVGLVVVPVATVVAMVVGTRGPVTERLGRVALVLGLLGAAVTLFAGVSAQN